MLETLTVLHESIANIVPIHGVADNGDGSYRVDYIDAVSYTHLRAHET